MTVYRFAFVCLKIFDAFSIIIIQGGSTVASSVINKIQIEDLILFAYRDLKLVEKETSRFFFLKDKSKPSHQ